MFWGTLDYSAPEVIRYGASAYTPATDWWAVGVLMYEMLYGAAPFAADSEEDTMAAICSGEVFLPDGPVQVSLTDVMVTFGLTWTAPKARNGSQHIWMYG
jgi:serine/threonine protein kinase